jgi:hypothetical protein
MADKKSTIAELTNAFNIKVTALQQQLKNNINAVNSLKANSNEKKKAIAALIVSYNNAVNKLKIKLANDIKAIQNLPNVSNINKKALLVGINYRGTSNELYGCINDTINVKNLLDQTFGFKKYVFLTDDTNKKPTKKNILEELTQLLVNSVSKDTLFFLYSGHGTCTTDVNKDEMDGQDELIVPIDATDIGSCILDDELNKIIQKELKQGVTLFALFDSCFSGTVLDLKYNYLDINTIVNPNVQETSGQVIMISGCMDNQTSADAYVNYNGKNMGSGAMTFSFLKTIQQLGVNITIKTLIETMRLLLKDNGYEQIPQLSSGKEINIDKTTLPFL